MKNLEFCYDIEPKVLRTYFLSGSLKRTLHKVAKAQARVLNADNSDAIMMCKSNIPQYSEKDSLSYHRSYLEYLQNAYTEHQGIIISPDYIWYTILCELSIYVQSHSDQCRNLFTKATEKTTLTVVTEDYVQVVDLIYEKLQQQITAIDSFVFPFSTTNPSTLRAFKCAFADLVSPYFNYCVYACGYPKIMILGTVEDWQLMDTKLQQLHTLFAEIKQTEISTWLERSVLATVQRIQKAIEQHDAKFFAQILQAKECGSGTEYLISGWITNFYLTKPGLTKNDNWPDHISNLKFLALETGKEYCLSHGLLCSELTLTCDYLVPMFGYVLSTKK